MSSDLYVYDLSSQTEGDAHLFQRRDVLSCIDLNTMNYASNMCTIQTDVLTNSSKWLNLYEGVLIVPISIFLTTSNVSTAAGNAFNPAATPCDYALGIKNSFLTMIHNISVQYNGVTITNQIPLCSMFNCFKLLTSMNSSDFASFASIGFSPDSLSSMAYSATATPGGIGMMNNANYAVPKSVTGSAIPAGSCNIGFLQRQNYFSYDPSAVGGGFTAASCGLVYKSYIGTPVAPVGTASSGIWSQFILAQIRLRDLHDVFAQMPLLKGSFLRLQLGLNNTSFTFSATNAVLNAAGTAIGTPSALFLTGLNSALGGVNPLMVASTLTNNGSNPLLYPTPTVANGTPAVTTSYIASIQVGMTCLNTTQVQFGATQMGNLIRSVTLTVPAYSFAPDIELSYLSQGQKKVVYNELFQYTIFNVANSGTINAIVSNGMLAPQEIYIVPVISGSTNFLNSNGTLALPAFQSPFDPCGGGSSSYIAQLTNVNVVVAGSNLLQKNTQYIFEAYGQNYNGQAGQVNGNLADSLGSGLIDELGFFYSPFYYCNLSRGLASDDLVLKSISVVAQNVSGYQLDLYVFITHKMDFTVDLRTGALV
jgi:hypothetical protein